MKLRKKNFLLPVLRVRKLDANKFFVFDILLYRTITINLQKAKTLSKSFL